jgi:transposase
MLYVGIDTAKKYRCCVFESEKKAPSEMFAFTYDRDGYDLLLKRISFYHLPPEKIKIGMEDIDPYSTNLASCLADNGFTPYIYTSEMVAQFRNTHTCQNAFPNRDDYLIVCMLRSDLDVEPYTKEKLEEKIRIRNRNAAKNFYARMVRERNEKRQNIARLVKLVFPELPQYIDLDSPAAHALLRKFPSCRKIAGASLRQLQKAVDTAYEGSEGRVSAELLEQIHEAAKNSKYTGDIADELELSFFTEDVDTLNSEILKMEEVLKKELD